MFTLTTDTSCDVFKSELKARNIPYIPLTYTLDDVTVKDEYTSDQEYSDFYKRISTGALPVTSQINSFLHEEFFDSLFAAGSKEIVHLSLSSGLSATYASACKGAENAMAKFPGCSVYVIDTLSATQGHRYLLDRASEYLQQDLDGLEAAQQLNILKNRLHHWVVVDDLMHLKRGGRVSGVAAYVGTVLNLKPILVVDQAGKLVVVQKVKGIKRGLSLFLQMLEKYGENINGGKIYLASADCHDTAQTLKNMILEKYDCEVQIGWIGPIIGTHTGLNTLGMVFEGRERLKK